jgi:hypothetical protein
MQVCQRVITGHNTGAEYPISYNLFIMLPDE